MSGHALARNRTASSNPASTAMEREGFPLAILKNAATGWAL